MLYNYNVIAAWDNVTSVVVERDKVWVPDDIVYETLNIFKPIQVCHIFKHPFQLLKK